MTTKFQEFLSLRQNYDECTYVYMTASDDDKKYKCLFTRQKFYFQWQF